MSKEMVWIRTLTVGALCAGVALMLGWMLATPTAIISMAFVALVLLALFFPLYMQWHHVLLVAAWHSAIIVFFLPGQFDLWTVLAFVSLGMCLLRYTLRRQHLFMDVPAITRPLIALTIVVGVTMILRGGVGGRALGSQLWGTKRYIWIFAAVAGYFALTSERIPAKRAELYAALFLLSAITSAISDFAYAAGPSFYPLFYVVSPEMAGMQAVSTNPLERFTGVAYAASAVCYYLIMRFGIRGLSDLRRPWRLVAFVTMMVAGLFGGFRSVLILLLLVLLVQFYFEGLFRSYLLPVGVLVTVMVAVLTVGFVDRLPLAVQRSLSFLPLRVDPIARRDALSTLDWRLEMWKVVVPEVPRYLLFGKGYGFDATEYLLTQEAMKRGLYSSYEDTLISGNYHNGLLTLVIPFSIFGLLSFLWFCWAALKVLHANYRNSPPEVKHINTFLLAYFTARLLFYLVFYGQFDQDLMDLVGAVAFGVALNGG
ncbi:MAG: hypothetical protein KGS61_11785, partial [Verrucomicrobia bacterium]|nr:hypothetical protein [Verrucomicrobiota bacterium]